MNIESFFEQWCELLNKDMELKRRLKPFKTFMGGPLPYIGPGPYPPPIPTHDPTGWTRAKGYAKPNLDNKELIELKVDKLFVYTFELKEGKFIVRAGSANGRPVLRVKMPKDVFKDMILTKQRVIWALADPRNEIECLWPEIGWSDWITVLEILVVGQELVERDPAMWDLIENL
ncbi:MAG: hypothetical protein QXL85_07250 [Candidatus Bathyarchaeia archaeon]